MYPPMEIWPDERVKEGGRRQSTEMVGKGKGKGK